ncbi:MAG: alpha/beta hydrolase [Bacteroidales bacterium]
MVLFYTDKAGRRIAYRERGEGDTIVLLHGYLESLLVWERFSTDLARHFRVLSVDLPGHGQSDVISEEHSMEMMAERIKGLLDYLGKEKVILTGHSLGGYVALAFLEMFPERLAGYCLFHSHPFADTDAAIERRKREISIVEAGKKNIMYPGNIIKMFAPDNIEIMKDEVERFNEIASLTNDKGIIAVLRGMMSRPSRLHLIESGKVPLLIILGIHDQYIDYGTIAGALRLPSNASMITLYESGHLGFVEEPERTSSVVLEFAFTVFGENSRA